MEQTIFNILSLSSGDDKASICLTKYISYISARAENENSFRKRFYQFGLQYLQSHPEFQHPISVAELSKYPELIAMLHGSLLPPLADEKVSLWALTVPNSDTVFYSTEAFYNLMSPQNPNGMYASATDAERESFSNSLQQMQYALLLERKHGIVFPDRDEIVYVWTDKTTGLPKYYSINIDNRFVEVAQTHTTPSLDIKAMKKVMKGMRSICELEEKIPLSSFRFEGFSIVTATDITPRYSLHKMRSAIIRHQPGDYDTTYNQIIFLLKALCGNYSLQFGLLPFLKVNNRPVSFYQNYLHSIAITAARNQQVDEATFLTWVNYYFEHPHIFFYNETDEETIRSHPLFTAFDQEGLKGYGSIPVYYNNELAGLLEIGTTDNNSIQKGLMARLDAALSILAQLMHNHQTEFKNSIENVIKTNFTSIQPAVEWKFNEVAWKYLKSSTRDALPAVLEPIRFEDVYPLYGAIDIRNSTIERNNALYEDMQVYFSLFDKTMQEVSSVDNAAGLLSEAVELQEQISPFSSASEEAAFLTFIGRVSSFLQTTTTGNEKETTVIKEYFAALDPDSGAVYQHRRALETTIQLINSYINQYIELMQTHVQETYPAYFEKFRTDGIEYDIYIGQSVSPDKQYKPGFISQLRFLQLRSMAAIARLVHANEAKMPLPLQTTQLIYVNANSIDISFRTNEKRFDVEGAYNIRYHIVKKRIDKVHISETGERLTQPGTIAIVYSHQSDGDEFKKYISILQEEGILQPTVEELSLEELQGVIGLHALRVRLIW